MVEISMDFMDWRPITCQLPTEMDTDSEIVLQDTIPPSPDEQLTNESEINSSGSRQSHTMTDAQLKVVTYMVWPDSMGLFARCQAEVQKFWTSLLKNTSLPPSITFEHEKIIAAFSAIDRIILEKPNDLWKLRLTYVRLARISSLILSLIATGRRKGRVQRGVGKGNASILIDMYMKAQKDRTSTEMRVQIQRRLRVARRWADLIGGSLFLAVVYSNKAEVAMYVTAAFQWIITAK